MTIVAGIVFTAKALQIEAGVYAIWLRTAMLRAELELVVGEAMNRLFARDACLLDGDASEWSVAHRLAVYLEELLPGWNIDCEFNRQGVTADPKAAANGARVRPDVIVHHRGRVELTHNLLVIELKKQSSRRDYEKACEYTSSPRGERQFQYRYGLTITMHGNWSLTWFENGQAAR